MAKGTNARAAPAKAKVTTPARGKAAPAAAPAKLAEPPATKPAAPVTVTLKHLAAGISEQHGLPKAQAEAVLAGVLARSQQLCHQPPFRLVGGDRRRCPGAILAELPITMES